MKERPILFSGPMVRAILEGRKTQTRRIIKDASGSFWDHEAWRPQVVNGAITGWISMDSMTDGSFFGPGSPQRTCPYGQPGDKLWVRESWCIRQTLTQAAYYRSTEPDASAKWKPSIHMPRWASRITLEVVSAHVERLQDISEEDAKAEGIYLFSHHGLFTADPSQLGGGRTAVEGYAYLWNEINGPGSWEANPWVWVIEFKRIKP